MWETLNPSWFDFQTNFEPVFRLFSHTCINVWGQPIREKRKNHWTTCINNSSDSFWFWKINVSLQLVACPYHKMHSTGGAAVGINRSSIWSCHEREVLFSYTEWFFASLTESAFPNPQRLAQKSVWLDLCVIRCSASWTVKKLATDSSNWPIPQIQPDNCHDRTTPNFDALPRLTTLFPPKLKIFFSVL